MAALLQYTLSNLGKDTPDESKGLTTASSLVQSLSWEETTREAGEQKFGLLLLLQGKIWELNMLWH